jgi:hypothetical protein
MRFFRRLKFSAGICSACNNYFRIIYVSSHILILVIYQTMVRPSRNGQADRPPFSATICRRGPLAAPGALLFSKNNML